MAKSRAEMDMIADDPAKGAPTEESLDKPPAAADTDQPVMDTPAPHSPPTCGRMIIDLIDTGDRPTPSVSFDPVGRFTGGMMEHYLTYFAQEIERAQAQARRERSTQGAS